MKQASTRDVLQELAEQPIGSISLQAEADARAASERLGNTKKRERSPELAETIDRTKKIWLPQGRKVKSRAESAEAQAAFYSKQIDIEDAIEQAGGKRGSAKAP